MRIAKVIGGVAATVVLAACPEQGQAPAKGKPVAVETADAGDAGPPIVVDAAGSEGGDGTVVVLEPAPGQGPIDPLSPEMLEAAARAAEAAGAAEAGKDAEAGADAVAEAQVRAAPTGAVEPPPFDPNEGRPVGRIVQLNPERVSPFTSLPARSADGRYLAVSRYEQHQDHALVEIVRVQGGRTVRRFDLGWDGSGARRINRALERGAFRTMRAVTTDSRSPADGDRRQRSTTWEMDDLELRYDPTSGGLAFYEGYRLIGQTLIEARPGNFPIGPEADGDRLVPDVLSVFRSEDGSVIAVELGLCNCSCDIDPYWRVFRRDALPMPG